MRKRERSYSLGGRPVAASLFLSGPGVVGSAACVAGRQRAADERSHRREPSHHVQLAADPPEASGDKQASFINAVRIACYAICRE